MFFFVKFSEMATFSSDTFYGKFKISWHQEEFGNIVENIIILRKTYALENWGNSLSE